MVIRNTDDKFEYTEGDLEITEYPEMREVHIKSPRRLETIIIYRPVGNASSFAVRYETGKPVGYLADGQYLSLRDAKEAVKAYLLTAAESHQMKRQAIQKDRQAQKDAEQKSTASK